MWYLQYAFVCALIFGLCLSSKIPSPPAVENADLNLVPDTKEADHTTDVENEASPEKAPNTSKVILASETRLLLVERLPGDVLQDCTVYTNRDIFNIETSGMPVVNVTEEAINEMDKSCQMFQARKHGLYRHRRGIDIVYPGTKWCGAGNTADDYDDLGTIPEVDKCCRAHDYCHVSIGSFENKYDIYNVALWTKSHCDCDSAFYDCLKEAGDKVIGMFYFNTLDIGCIKKDWQYTCAQEGFWFDCARYEPDTSKPKVYVFEENHLVY